LGLFEDEAYEPEQLINKLSGYVQPGYPACPDHTEKGKLFQLLNVTEKPA
jgi:5-methyltetrahydrofolate--homocysteine methyltransferase